MLASVEAVVLCFSRWLNCDVPLSYFYLSIKASIRIVIKSPTTKFIEDYRQVSPSMTVMKAINLAE